MPKKQPRNAFYFYMLDFKDQQRKKGINYENLGEVATAAGPSWRDASPQMRATYEARAKQEKNKHNIPEHKFTSTGIPLSEIAQQERERREMEEAELQDIISFVNQKSFNGSILTEDIYLMDVNVYCMVGNEYLIGESTILRFNLKEGIKDSYHELINPGGIPVGYANDVKLGCQEYGLEMPHDAEKRSNYIHVLAKTIDYLKQHDRAAKSLPPLFTMPSKVAPVLDFIQQMCNRAAEDDTLFRVYRLDTLFYWLVKAASDQRELQSFPSESFALAQLQKDPFKYTPGLGCEAHESGPRPEQCSTARVKRWAYTLFDSYLPRAGLPAAPSRHLPAQADLDSILLHKEQKRERGVVSARVAGAALDAGSRDSSFSTVTANSTADSSGAWGAASANRWANSSASASANTSASTVEGPQKPKRTHVPLRLPKTDYSQSIRAPPNLNSEEDFPDSLKPKGGHGRGRGLAATFGNMRM